MHKKYKLYLAYVLNRVEIRKLFFKFHFKLDERDTMNGFYIENICVTD